MAIFNSKLLNYQRVRWVSLRSPFCLVKIPRSTTHRAAHAWRGRSRIQGTQLLQNAMLQLLGQCYDLKPRETPRDLSHSKPRLVDD